MGAKRELILRSEIDGSYEVVQLRLGKAVDLKRAGENFTVFAALRGDPRHDRFIEHGDHFLRHAGKPNETFALAHCYSEPGRGAHRIGNDNRRVRKTSLFEIVRRPSDGARCEALLR